MSSGSNADVRRIRRPSHFRVRLHETEKIVVQSPDFEGGMLEDVSHEERTVLYSREHYRPIILPDDENLYILILDSDKSDDYAAIYHEWYSVEDCDAPQ